MMVQPISTRGSTEKESGKNKEPEEQKTKNKKNADKKSTRPSYRVPTKRRRATPSDHSDMAVLLKAVSQMAVLFGQ